MFKLYLADINYNIIAPIIFNTGGISSGALFHQVGQSRELKLQFNTLLEEQYDFLLLPETKLVLEINNTVRIGFNKDNNIITDLCSYGEIGAGSDLNSCIRIDGAISPETNYPINTEFVTDNTYKAYYISNEVEKKKIKGRYYKIKAFSLSNLQELHISNLEQAKSKLYNESIDYLKSKQGENSIEKQVKRLNGVVDLTFYSSSFDLNFSKRLLPVNQDYQGKLYDLVNQLDSNFDFVVLDNININLNTGTYSNYELLNQICKNRSLSWREIGLITDSYQNIKTRIEIGDFDKLQPSHFASNLKNDDWFGESFILIKDIKGGNNSTNVELDIKKWVQEGDNIQIQYKQYIDDKVIFDINKIQNYKGSIADLTNYL